MSTHLSDEFRRILPAGEWNIKEIIDKPGGMMDEAAVHARAIWNRTGQPCYLKCIKGRGASASPSTAALASSVRLEALRDRLVLAADSGSPLVKLLRVDFIGNPKWLLIAMDEVTPIARLIAQGVPNIPLALRVLEDLRSEKCGDWIHFDICPQNTATDPDGRAVFIDPESFFRVAERDNGVSIGAHKDWRLPEPILNACRMSFESGSFSKATLQQKHDAEVILVAAECCLGFFAGDSMTAETADTWCRESSAPDNLRAFWLGILQDLCQNGNASIQNIVEHLREYLAPSPEPSGQPRLAGPPKAQFDYEALNSWSDFAEVRVSMRQRVLGPTELGRYRDRILVLARANTGDRRWWVELLMITLTYARNPSAAREFAREALAYFPGDPEFSHDRLVAERSLG